jgi:hypothetical protein
MAKCIMPGRPGELPNFLVESVQLKHTLTGGLQPPGPLSRTPMLIVTANNRYGQTIGPDGELPIKAWHINMNHA